MVFLIMVIVMSDDKSVSYNTKTWVAGESTLVLTVPKAIVEELELKVYEVVNVTLSGTGIVMKKRKVPKSSKEHVGKQIYDMFS